MIYYALLFLVSFFIGLMILLKKVTWYNSLRLEKGVTVKHFNVLPHITFFSTPSYLYCNIGWLFLGIQIDISFFKTGINTIKNWF